MSVVGGEASLDWLDLRRPEFDGSGLREDGDHDGYPFSVLLDSQDFALPASVRATDDSNLIARLHTHWHHLKEDSPLAYVSRVASALASDRANATYQPRRALRDVGCMRCSASVAAARHVSSPPARASGHRKLPASDSRS